MFLNTSEESISITRVLLFYSFVFSSMISIAVLYIHYLEVKTSGTNTALSIGEAFYSVALSIVAAVTYYLGKMLSGKYFVDVKVGENKITVSNKDSQMNTENT